MVYPSALALALVAPLLALASPTQLQKRQSISTLSQSQISAFKPYTYFASAAYCDPSKTINWSCGTNCQANKGFKTVATGGDGVVTQYWYVGFDPSLKSIIVAHQGTVKSEIVPLITDIDFFLTPLDPTLFPGVPFTAEAHYGFVTDQARTASDILAAVKEALSQFNVKKVTTVGHSLGAALALLDAAFLPLHLPSSVKVNAVTYGLPRVGNQAFANYLDSSNIDITHINNKEDPVPTLPPISLGFHHPAGEIHIQDSGAWDGCPGQDNPSTLCSRGDVSSILEGNLNNHDGPYDGVTMGC